MTKYIWLTAFLIAIILALAYKQAPNEPEVSRPMEDDPFSLEIGEPSVSESGNISVTQPQPYTWIASPLLVKGEARVFEGTVQFRLKDADGNIITEKFGTAAAEEIGAFGSFGELLVFDEPNTEEGVLEVYSESAADGSVQDLVSIPVRF
ncbi:MAG: Gmad2 immunoglobulin-like domain-containing protein [bacterium]|nr:Gmad2 immunoglobulin-like domain-containing protein [bacterium]